MPLFKKFTDVRLQMFKYNPPDFYREYGSCPKEYDPGINYRLPDFIKNDYVRLFNDGKESCLFVKKSKLKNITSEQWKKANEFLFSLDKTI